MSPAPPRPGDDDLVRLLAELVATDSVNPGLDPTGAGERGIADRVEAWSRAHALDVRRVGPAERPSLIVSTTRTRPGPTLLLCGHLDTVGHGSMPQPTTPVVRDGRMYGRGTYDMKGGLAAALVAAARLNQASRTGPVTVAAVADEEHLSAGTAEVLRHVTADAAVVTEPTELQVAVAHRGFAWVRIDIAGRAAHGSRPHLGVDAIVAAGPVLTALGRLPARLDRIVHPLLGPAVVHASLIDGGTEESTVPEHCSIVVERRTLPGETGATALAEIDRLLDEARRHTPAATFTATLLVERDPMQTPDQEPIVQAALAAHRHLREDGWPDSRPAGLSYWADSALLSGAGIPTVLLGPVGDGAHARREWVDLRSVLDTARLLEETAVRFSGPRA